MPINIKSNADYWAKLKGDTATTGDGSSNTAPSRFDQWNADIGNAQTTATDDGDLQNIDTIAEAYTVNPAANTSGNGSVKYSLNFLFRWLIQIVQNLRVQGNIASATTDSGNPVKIGGVYNATLPTLTDGQRGNIQLSNRGFAYVDFLDLVSSAINISAADAASSSVTGQNSQAIITGTPTANSTASLALGGDSSFSVLVTGTWVGTLQFERSLDNGTTWTPVAAFSAGTSYTGSTITSNGAFHGNCSSSTNVRVRATAWTSGIAVVRLLAGAGTGTITIGNPLRLFDAVSGAQASIKAASTPAAATDTAVVVDQRPGTILPANITQFAGTTLSSTNPVPVRPSINVTRVTCTTLTRPADTTAYSINDSISNSTSSPVARTFTGAVSANGGSGEIVRVYMKNSDAITGSVRLYLMNGNSAPTAVADNASYSTYTDLQTNCIGYIDFGPSVPGRMSEGLLSSGSTLPFTCGGSTTSLFGQVMCLQAFTPTSGMTFDFEIWVVDRN